MSNLKKRFLLVSDMHYTTEEKSAAFREKYPDANTSVAAGNAFGGTQREKIEQIYRDICTENSRQKLDGVFVLGDLSIDDAPYRNLPWNFCQKFKESCMDRLPCPAYALAGNHDSYCDEIWQEVFGYGRQYAVEIGECVFLMADTFASVPAVDPSGSLDTPLDEHFLQESLEKYQGKKIFLCAHYLGTPGDKTCSFTESVRRLIAENDDIVCMFRGHTHINEVVDLDGHKIVDIGGYGYSGMCIDGRWDFNIFDFRWAWGYQILEVYDDHVRTYHVKPAKEYVATNGVFSVPETVEDDIVL